MRGQRMNGVPLLAAREGATPPEPFPARRGILTRCGLGRALRKKNLLRLGVPSGTDRCMVENKRHLHELPDFLSCQCGSPKDRRFKG